MMPGASSSRSSLWLECVQGYQWPEEVRSAFHDGNEPMFDKCELLRLANEGPEQGHFALTFLSKEYFPLGLLWTRFALNAGIRRFVIAATDSETFVGLQKLGFPVVEVYLPPELSRMAHYRNRGGFNGNALALIYSRMHLIKFLVENRIDVLSCDIDALITKNPEPYFTDRPDIAFQRVVYFPKPLAKIWGFAACAGFVSYRASTKVAALLSRALDIQREVSSDQLALNYAFWELGIQWGRTCSGFDTEQALVTEFTAIADQNIYGHLPGTQITLKALPATTFWRHKFIPLIRETAVIVHPNSPKTLEGKLDVFSNILSADEMSFQQV